MCGPARYREARPGPIPSRGSPGPAHHFVLWKLYADGDSGEKKAAEPTRAEMRRSAAERASCGVERSELACGACGERPPFRSQHTRHGHRVELRPESASSIFLAQCWLLDGFREAFLSFLSFFF
jgi:hypothetical protein